VGKIGKDKISIANSLGATPKAGNHFAQSINQRQSLLDREGECSIVCLRMSLSQPVDSRLLACLELRRNRVKAMQDNRISHSVYLKSEKLQERCRARETLGR
jgi:hypothetical protein